MRIVEFTDPNFGMYDNDTRICTHIRTVQDEYGYPERIQCSTGKSQPNKIIKNAKILKKNSMMIRAAVQSMNESTLEKIARKNLPLNVFKDMSDQGIETYSDIMLSLPGETKESYLNGIYELIDFGIDEFSMLQTILLKGTEMESEEYKSKYGLKTKFRVIPECDGIYSVENFFSRVTETEEIIYETSALSFEDYLNCRIFALIIMIFHNTRMLRPLYYYLDNKNIPRSLIIKNIFEEIGMKKS